MEKIIENTIEKNTTNDAIEDMIESKSADQENNDNGINSSLLVYNHINDSVDLFTKRA